MLASDYEPLLPRKPGQHGARISGVIQNEDDTPCHLFVRRGQAGYRYYEVYKTPRHPDKISCAEMTMDVPEYVKGYWARVFGGHSTGGKDPKALKAIRDAWPMKPVGWWDQVSNSMIKYVPDLERRYGEPLKRSITDAEAEAVTSVDIMAAFHRKDGSIQPTMRLFYEYMQCIEYDRGVYEILVAKKHELGI
ncbi:hypothetical protein PVAG01_10053 [Phlyctema vagabunda]|uniref:DUF6697 domain-containing protein n=1 Tax=Phlyctema vagabunda TaxID=108571 RepID=A0ABR4P4V5_9HELO